MADPRSEPSMEDILASIKRIIADDQPLPLDRPVPEPVARPDLPRPPAWPEQAPAVFDRPSAWPTRTEPPQPPESILELTELVPETTQPPRVPPAGHSVPEVPSAEATVPQPELPAQPQADRLRQPDISWQTPEALRPSPAPLSASRSITRDIGEMIVNRGSGGDNTLEGLVRDMLRPMLSDWIDTHLPGMVERLVQEEIRKMMEREGGSE